MRGPTAGSHVFISAAAGREERTLGRNGVIVDGSGDDRSRYCDGGDGGWTGLPHSRANPACTGRSAAVHGDACGHATVVSSKTISWLLSAVVVRYHTRVLRFYAKESLNFRPKNIRPRPAPL